MKFNFSDEQEEFRSGLRRFLDDKSPSSAVRRLMEADDGYDRDVWRSLSRDLGLTAIHTPEAYGGQGFGISELCIVCEEMGRALLCAPFFASTVLATTAILKAGAEDQKRALLPSLVGGETIATLAVAEDTGQWNVGSIATTASRAGEGYRLTGTKSFVLDGRIADQFIVVAREPNSTGTEGVSFFTVAHDAPGLAYHPLQTMDMTRKLVRVTFTDVPAEILGAEGAGAQALGETLDIAAICLANEMVGGAARLLESAIEYAKLRYQFGRPIASFQSLKHKAADMLLDVELAKSAAYYAAAAADEGIESLPAIASLAKAAAGDAYMQTAVHTVQIHGGIGFTWDNDTHLWFKRAKSSQVFLGTATDHRERFMQQQVA